VRVFVLGAGSSKLAGFPLAKELMGELRDYLEGRRSNHPRNFARTWDSLLRRGIFRKGDDAELNFTRLQMHVLSLVTGAGTAYLNKPDVEVSLYRYLPMLIDLLFEDRHSELAEQPNRMSYLRDFVRRHMRPRDVVVTFNYDCLVEIAMKAEKLWGLRRGYGFDLAKSYPDLKTLKDVSACEVIKLHGSAGWRSIAEPRKELLLEEPFLDLLSYRGLRRRHPTKRRLSNIDNVVLPAYLKTFSTYPLPALWKRASDLLRLAKRVVVLGYSVPQADSAARALLLSSIPAGSLVDFYSYKMDRQAIREIHEFFAGAGIEMRQKSARVEDLARMNHLPLG